MLHVLAIQFFGFSIINGNIINYYVHYNENVFALHIFFYLFISI